MSNIEKAALAAVVKELLPHMDPTLPNKVLAAHDEQVRADERERIGADLARRASDPGLIERADRWAGYYAGVLASLQAESARLARQGGSDDER